MGIGAKLKEKVRYGQLSKIKTVDQRPLQYQDVHSLIYEKKKKNGQDGHYVINLTWE